MILCRKIAFMWREQSDNSILFLACLPLSLKVHKVCRSAQFFTANSNTFCEEVIKLAHYLSVEPAAERIAGRKKTSFRRIKDGSITAVQLGPKTIRISVEELDRYMKGQAK